MDAWMDNFHQERLSQMLGVSKVSLLSGSQLQGAFANAGQTFSIKKLHPPSNTGMDGRFFLVKAFVGLVLFCLQASACVYPSFQMGKQRIF